MGEVFVGTCSWTDPTLIRSGRFYPAEAKSAEARLQFHASQFRLVEVDSTYYSMPREETAVLWAKRTGPDFVFDVKAFRLFTQAPHATARPAQRDQGILAIRIAAEGKCLAARST